MCQCEGEASKSGHPGRVHQVHSHLTKENKTQKSSALVVVFLPICGKQSKNTGPISGKHPAKDPTGMGSTAT